MQSPKMPGTLSFIQVRTIRYPHLSVVKNKVLRGKLELLRQKTRAAARASQGLSTISWKTD